MKKRILLIDFYNAYIRSFYVVPISNSNGEHFGGTIGFLNNLKSVIDKVSPSEVYIISDGPGSSMRRKRINKDYKGNRDREWKRGSVRAFDFLNENEMESNFKFQIERLKEYLSILPVKMIEIPFVEADDIIAEIANKYYDDSNVIIYSTDKDFLQLLNDHVFVFHPTTKKIVNKNTFLEKYELLSDNYIYLKIIEGDTSDNVKGIRGVARKTFLKMFPSVKNKKIENLNELFEMAEHAIDSKSKVYTPGMVKKLNLIVDSKNHMKQNWELMQLTDVDISLQSKDLIKKFVETENVHVFNRTQLKLMFIKDQVEGTIKSMHDWSRVFTQLTIRSRNV